MPSLFLHQTDLDNDRYRITVSSDLLTLRHDSEFEFQLTAQDQADIRWYLEDFLQYPMDPNPQIAARVEARMAELGAELFDKLFNGRELILFWGRLMDQLADLRVEVSTSVAGATALPWELLRDPQTGKHLCLSAAEFVRGHRDQVQQPRLPEQADKIRILLVICRPKEEQDVPFRSVASQLARGLNQQARAQVDLTVLRPPTYEQLGRVLQDAKDQGRPFHLMHFDGHGTYADLAQLKDSPAIDRDRFRGKPTGRHGFLLFEDPKSKDNNDYVDGKVLGELLVKTDVPVLVLNACRSAHAESQEPDEQTAEPASGQDSFAAGGRPGAFGSLAQEVMDTGVAGVVAMRYNVWVVTAAQFVFELYRNLARGQSLGAAVSRGRRHLFDQPNRRIAYRDIALQDWPVPVVFEAAPVRLLSAQTGDDQWRLELGAGVQEQTQDQLPPPPDIGFIGRDETLLALDRAFDQDAIVLLHAYAGSGKTATAAEFARWYRQTGGLGGNSQAGVVLFSSFESYRPLYQVLGDLGEVFAPLLAQNGIQWGAVAELAERRPIALQILSKIPVLWIWDNVEPVVGFPAGTESAWSAAEQQELVDFLRALKQTRAKLLITSRRDEQAWLGDLPRRIQVPPMPMPERAAFAEALAAKSGQRLAAADWRPLLRFSEGNPLTLTVLIRQALRQRLADPAAIRAFVEQLQSGEQAFDDQTSQLRERSLAASLSYGFEQAFSEPEQRILALLVFFQGFVDVKALQIMGVTESDWGLTELQGQGREQLIPLLDRAVELGLLTGLGGGYYHIHPALPWFFRRLFERSWPELGQERARRAFVEALGELGNYYHAQYQHGRREVIGLLRQEEANLLHAWRLARRHGYWHRVISVMQGLGQLYDHTGRRAEWAALVEAVTPEFVDADDGPLPGREEQWSLFAEYRVRLAREARDWERAEALQRRTVEWDLKQAEDLLERTELDAADRNRVRSLAASLHELGEIQRGLEQAGCVAAYEESLTIAERIGDKSAAASCALNLGHVYKDLAKLRDLAQADHWYQRSLELRPEADRKGKGGSMAQLGAVAWERAREAIKAQAWPEAETQVKAALGHYHQALELLPADAVDDLAVVHNQLGMIYRNIGQLDAALHHYQECIRSDEAAGNWYGASTTRFNVALALLQAKRQADALAYARAALQGFERYGERARDMIDRTQALIARIEAQ